MRSLEKNVSSSSLNLPWTLDLKRGVNKGHLDMEGAGREEQSMGTCWAQPSSSLCSRGYTGWISKTELESFPLRLI